MTICVGDAVGDFNIFMGSELKVETQLSIYVRLNSFLIGEYQMVFIEPDSVFGNYKIVTLLLPSSPVPVNIRLQTLHKNLIT